MDKYFETLATLGSVVAGVAIIAVIVSNKSQTPAIIQNSGSAFSNALDVAVSPVTGNNVQGNLSYAGSSGLANTPSFDNAPSF